MYRCRDSSPRRMRENRYAISVHWWISYRFQIQDSIPLLIFYVLERVAPIRLQNYPFSMISSYSWMIFFTLGYVGNGGKFSKLNVPPCFTRKIIRRFSESLIFIATFASRWVTLIATHSKAQKQTRLPIRYLFFIFPLKPLINKEVIKVFQNYLKNLALRNFVPGNHLTIRNS